MDEPQDARSRSLIFYEQRRRALLTDIAQVGEGERMQTELVCMLGRDRSVFVLLVV
jgi:hypothetical protein